MEIRAQEQVVIMMKLQSEQMAEEKNALIEELAKTKKVERVTKEQLS